jgi:hypothetical protein
VRSSVRGILLASAGVVAWAAAAATASAQELGPPASGGQAIFLTRSDFFFQWSAFKTPDPRFRWEAYVGIDSDLFDNRAWRLNFSAEYDAVLGRERRPFDLNQGTYVMDGVVARRLGWVELAGVARHVSRHLTDRENQPAISWNVVAVRAGGRQAIGRTIVEGDLQSGRAMQQAFVDYRWISELRLRASHPIGGRHTLFARASGIVINVDHAIADRPRVCGGRIVGGIDLGGAAGGIELFAGYERRLDAFPTDRFRVRTLTIGFRLTGR